MKTKELSKEYQVNSSLLMDYGFILKDKYVYYCDGINGFHFEIFYDINKHQLEYQALDENNEVYIPFQVSSATGSLVTELRNQAEEILLDIQRHCFIYHSIIDNILEYVKNKYGTIPLYPWEDTPEYATLNAKNGKWYALLAKIKGKCLGLPIDEIQIINVKLEPEEIQNLIDDKVYFKAYHMNKKYWITILLDRVTDKELLFQLIDKSYNLIKK